ncbi:MAG: phospholipase D-like domain-containing protein [Candidatus Micrarchaeia archaeon]|jgi:phosphatidylserine/phosphatidylglycerophosphate/cardiolipin synthase-like enzyme
MRFRFTLTQLFIAFCIGILFGTGFLLLLANMQGVPALPSPASSSSSVPAQISSIFSPNGEDEILSSISSSTSSLDVEMYLFSYQKLADALIDAKARGVAVRVLLEPTLENNPNLQMAEYLRAGGIEVRWAIPSRTNHAKFAIIDGKRVLVGSHNWSYSAMNRNREASVLVQDAETVREFESVFEQDWAAAYT